MDAPTPPEETSASETAALRDPAENLDEEFTPHRREGLGTVTMLLAVLVLVGGGFLAGAYVQKTHTPVSATRVTRAGGAGGVGRATGRGATAAAGAGTGAAPAPTGSSTATAPPSAQAGPAVIGQIIKVTGNTLLVQNLAGKQVTVTLTQDTTVTKAATTRDLATGQTVTVGGTTGPDGTVDAATVLSR